LIFSDSVFRESLPAQMTISTQGERLAPAGAYRQPESARGPSPDGIDPAQIFRRIGARWKLLVQVAGALFVVIAIVIFTLTPRYTTSAQILLEAPPVVAPNPLDPNPQAQPSADSQKVASEIEVLMAPAMVDRAIADLNLTSNPEFNPTLSSAGLMSRLSTALFGADPGEVHADVVDRFYQRLKVYEVNTSRVITVEFSSADPVLARDGANEIASLYIRDQRAIHQDANAQTTAWLGQQINALRPRVADAEAKAEAFRAKTGLLEGQSGAELQSQQLTELNTQLTAARAARSEAEAKVAALERASANPDADDSASAVLQSPLIQQLRASEVQLKRDITDMSAQLLPTHPDMVKKQAELNDLQTQIRAEIQKVIASLHSDVNVAAAREATIQGQMDQLKSQRAGSDQNAVTLRELEREATADRTLLETYLQRYADASSRGDLSIQGTDARIVSRADLPVTPSFPQKGPLLMLDLMVSLSAGLFAVLLAEMTARTLRFPRDVERMAGVPVLAVMPSVARNPQDETLRNPDGDYADAIYSLQAGLGLGRGRDGKGRVVLVTSTERGEGRSTTTIALGRSLAQTGLRVLLIDGDFNRPDLSAYFRLERNWGFTDLVAGRAHFRQAIARDPASSMLVTGVGHNPPSVIMSSRFVPVMEQLAAAYDVILVDCAPTSEWGSAQLFMQAADQCVYAVRWNRTDRHRLAAGIKRLSFSDLRGGVSAVLTRGKSSAA
jgi:capsular exopolysaccharide synthesis family protein